MIKKTLIFSNSTNLSVKNKQLKINQASEVWGKEKSEIFIPIEDIGVLILDNPQITITNACLQSLLEVNASVVITDKSHMPLGMLFVLNSNTLQQERFTNQINASLPLKKNLWQQTVVSKITNQANLLKTRNVPCNNMFQWANDVNSGDTQNHEARAAAYYWDNVFENIVNFRRGRFEDFPNNLLNYGYAILRAIVARSLVGSGLLPTLGIHHRNKYNAYCLADDIMEPYRPFVDKVVIDIMENYDGEIEELTPELKRQLLIIPAMDVEIDGQKSPLMIATQRTSSSLQKCFANEIRKISYPEYK